MITVIIAGGSGTRLWPLSTPTYPKHLLKLTGERSLVQSTYDRVKDISDSVYIVTEEGHSDVLREQLPELSDDAFVIEPARRGTAGCFIAVLHKLQATHDHEEPILFIHADHVVRDKQGFGLSLKEAGEASKAAGRVTLIGIEPTYASTGFGYIEKDGQVGELSAFNVAAFKEKPDYDTASQYLESGRYLWNCGYFAGSVNTFLAAFEKYSPQWKGYYDQLLATTDEASYRDTYLSFENDAIDYALSEKADNFMVVPATFDWMDVGSFKDLHNAVPLDEDGNYQSGNNVHGIEVENAYIRNDEDKPVAVIGLDNVVVVNTPHGVLVTRKDLSQRVGEVAKKIQNNG